MTSLPANILEEISWNDQGLVPAIAQDAVTGRVLMMAWMNLESLQATYKSGFVTYWSRSRQRLWCKGESSGNQQKVQSIQLDCDGDTVLILVEQIGGIACHTGRNSCLYRELRSDDSGNPQWVTTEEVIKSPQEMYSNDS